MYRRRSSLSARLWCIKGPPGRLTRPSTILRPSAKVPNMPSSKAKAWAKAIRLQVMRSERTAGSVQPAKVESVLEAKFASSADDRPLKVSSSGARISSSSSLGGKCMLRGWKSDRSKRLISMSTSDGQVAYHGLHIPLNRPDRTQPAPFGALGSSFARSSSTKAASKLFLTPEHSRDHVLQILPQPFMNHH